MTNKNTIVWKNEPHIAKTPKIEWLTNDKIVNGITWHLPLHGNVSDEIPF